MKISAVALVVAVSALAGSGCGGSETTPSSGEGLPGPVADTRSAILAAAESGEYEPLRDVVDSKSFLSDFGFGDELDPVGRWEQVGPKPLETMGTLLRMPHAVRRRTRARSTSGRSSTPTRAPPTCQPRSGRSS